MEYVYENDGYGVRVADGLITTPSGSLPLAQVVAVRVARGGRNPELPDSVVGRFLTRAMYGLLAFGMLCAALREFPDAGRSLGSAAWVLLYLVALGWFLYLGWWETPVWVVVAGTAAGEKVVAECRSAADAADVRAGVEGGLRDLAARGAGHPPDA